LALNITLSDNWARYEVAQGETAQRKDDWPRQREPGRGDPHSLKPGVDARKEAIRANERALKDMEQTLPHR
jgi:hypothetical protein